MGEQGPIVDWIVDDTGLVKKGTHSVGVARQYCGQVGKQENCRVGVNLSLSTMKASLPMAWRLYLPEAWTQDKERRKATGVPEEIGFQTKPEIALQQIRTAVDRQIPSAPVLADAGYGNDTKFREGITEAGLLYVVWPRRLGIQVTRTRRQRRKHRRMVVGPVDPFRDGDSVMRATTALRRDINMANAGGKGKPITLSQLADHYCLRELAPNNRLKTHFTKLDYRGDLRKWIVPRWGGYTLARIRAGEIELWLRCLPLAVRRAQRSAT